MNFVIWLEAPAAQWIVSNLEEPPRAEAGPLFPSCWHQWGRGNWSRHFLPCFFYCLFIVFRSSDTVRLSVITQREGKWTFVGLLWMHSWRRNEESNSTVSLFCKRCYETGKMALWTFLHIHEFTSSRAVHDPADWNWSIFLCCKDQNWLGSEKVNQRLYRSVTATINCTLVRPAFVYSLFTFQPSHFNHQ